MTQEEISQKAHEAWVDEKSSDNTVAEGSMFIQGYLQGVKMLLECEEWKNLYAEGIEMGRKIERSIQTGNPIE